MKEFWDSVLNNIKNRVGTPFLSAMLFSLIIMNWESFIVIFQYGSEKFTYNDIDYIHAMHYINNNFIFWDVCYNNPLFYGVIYALIIPLITNLSKWYDKFIYSIFYESYKRWTGKYPKPEDIKKANIDLENSEKRMEELDNKIRSAEIDIVSKDKIINKNNDRINTLGNEIKTLNATQKELENNKEVLTYIFELVNDMIDSEDDLKAALKRNIHYQKIRIKEILNTIKNQNIYGSIEDIRSLDDYNKNKLKEYILIINKIDIDKYISKYESIEKSDQSNFIKYINKAQSKYKYLKDKCNNNIERLDTIKEIVMIINDIIEEYDIDDDDKPSVVVV